MERWVLIGGAGFTGKKIVEKLLKNKIPKSKIIIADTENSLKNITLNLKLEICDISKNILPIIKENDIIIHLAARQYHNKVPKFNQYNWFKEVNIIGTSYIIQECLKRNVKGLIYFSSDMIYGIPNNIPVKTHHPKNPIGPYGKSKLEAEKLCIKARKQGLKVSILRPRLIMGAGRLGIMEKLFKAIALNKPIPLIGNGNNIYQMVSVEDCAEATILIASKNCPNIELNLGSKPKDNVKTLLNTLIKQVNSSSLLIPCPSFLAKTTLKIIDNLGFTILHAEQYKIANKNYIVDISDTYSKLGWIPKYSDKDMIIDAYKFWKKNQ